VRARKVLLIGWDAADWKVIRPLMDTGRMPNVRRLVAQGASGPIATLYPPLSPMLWTSICTGKRPFRHGIHGFAEPAPDGSGVRPVTNLSRTAKALWNILNQNELRSIVVGWWPSHPAEPINGVMVSDLYHRAGGPLHEGWPMPAYTVHPPQLAPALADLRVHPDQITPRLVEPFIPRAGEIDQDRDTRLAALLRTLAECLSIQSAATWLLDHERWDFFAVYYEAIDHFCHSFMRYHPPRQQWINERDFELYQNVVSRAYQLHDEMLGTLLEKAGPETTVILMSDHGFHPDHLRPSSIPEIPAGPAIEHRDYGVLAIRGPGVKKHAVLHAASVLDIAPTILQLYGLPVGADMDGRVLSHAFVSARKIHLIPSWEEIPGADGRHAPHTRLDPVAAHESLEQMIALGYIERPEADREAAIHQTVRDLRFNLGEAYQDAGRHREAHEIFLELRQDDPDEQRFAVRLFASCQALEKHDEMRGILDDLAGRRMALFEEAQKGIGAAATAAPLTAEEQRALSRWRNLARFQPAVIDYLKARLLAAEKQYGEALAALERVTEGFLARPGLFLEAAELYQRVGREREARQAYEKALALDPDHTQAHLGLCRMALRRRNFHAASRSALDALQRTYHDPAAHFLLGRALAGMKEYSRAAEAFRAALSVNPNYPEAHARLAGLLEKHLGDQKSARAHRRLARAMKARLAHASSPPENPTVPVGAPKEMEISKGTAAMPPLSECLLVVTGLPRSGTSMVMQMLAAGGIRILSDERRAPDEDNPRGYLEFEPVKNLRTDSQWLVETKGKAIKIVAPLLSALPAGLACRAILCERDLEEVLDSQERMLQRRNARRPATAARRRMLKGEYQRTLNRVKAMLARRPNTHLLVIEHRAAIADAPAAAGRINHFLGGGLDIAKMAAAVQPELHRNRATILG